MLIQVISVLSIALFFYLTKNEINAVPKWSVGNDIESIRNEFFHIQSLFRSSDVLSSDNLFRIFPLFSSLLLLVITKIISLKFQYNSKGSYVCPRVIPASLFLSYFFNEILPCLFFLFFSLYINH